VATEGTAGVAITADTRTRLAQQARRIRQAGRQAAALAVHGGRDLWTNRERPEEQVHLRWGAAALLVLVGVISAMVVPRAPDALAAGPEFDRASIAASADPPAALPVQTAAGPVAAPQVQPVNVALPLKPTIPVGKGMWIHVFNRAKGGNPDLIVNHALSHGLTHIYVRLGSTRMGFYAQNDLDRLLPVAHANGIKVIGWDFPYLDNLQADVERAAAEMAYTTPSGQRIDGFSADIETPSEGTKLSTDNVTAYGNWVRHFAGPQMPLILAVPRPNPKRWYPYEAAAKQFDAIAPMVYWINRDPGTDVANASHDLAPLGKPIIPVGQAYDPGIDGSHSWGPPDAAAINKFMQTAADLGVASYSFWSWDTASPEVWATISASKLLQLRPLFNGPDLDERVAALQRVLKGLGQPVVVDGTFGAHTQAALADVQRQLGIPTSGQLDKATLQALKQPR
jgi:hypothetical protein